MRSTFRPRPAGAARSAMWCIGQARRRPGCGAKSDPAGGRGRPVGVVASARRWPPSPAPALLATGRPRPSHAASTPDSGYYVLSSLARRLAAALLVLDVLSLVSFLLFAIEI